MCIIHYCPIKLKSTFFGKYAATLKNCTIFCIFKSTMILLCATASAAKCACLSYTSLPLHNRITFVPNNALVNSFFFWPVDRSLMFLSLDDNRINLIKKILVVCWTAHARRLPVPFEMYCYAAWCLLAIRNNRWCRHFYFYRRPERFPKIIFFYHEPEKKNLEENENLLDWIEATNIKVWYLFFTGKW